MTLSGAPTLASPRQPVKAAILAYLYDNGAWAAQCPLKFPETAVPFLAGTYEDPLFDLKIGTISAVHISC